MNSRFEQEQTEKTEREKMPPFPPLPPVENPAGPTFPAGAIVRMCSPAGLHTPAFPGSQKKLRAALPVPSVGDVNTRHPLLAVLILGTPLTLPAAGPATPKFRAVDVDTQIQIGYGVTVADVNGDKKPDILLADKSQIVWYENPGWQKHVIAEKLTPQDNVCIAAADIDGDGKCEIAVGAGWDPGDTLNSGALFYMIPPADRTQKWTP